MTTEKIWNEKWDILKYLMQREYPERQNEDYGKFYHYTSIPVLFNILEGNELWASNVRFSNDSMEERMLRLENLHERDDYIICFCAEDDMLSQWRGYCHDGGVAIKLNLKETQTYSILHGDFDKTGNHVLYENTPLPVIYLNPTGNVEGTRERVQNAINKNNPSSGISLEKLLPYLKNGLFYEEKEQRLVFSNADGCLSKCIRFRALTDGIKVPYIVVRYGDVGKMKGNCRTDVAMFSEEYIKEQASNSKAIWIEEGFDQEKKYYEVIKYVEHVEKEGEMLDPIHVFCKGRLPIEEITVAPTYDRDRKVEQIKRFCMSKYWLNRVRVKVSNIPYIR